SCKCSSLPGRSWLVSRSHQPIPSCRMHAMKYRRLSLSLALTAVCGLVLPPSAIQAATPSTPAGASQASSSARIIHDVALGADGTLLGIVVDSQGVPLAKVPVVVRQGTMESARTVTGADGRFLVRGLRGGVYDVAAGQGSGTFRLWAANTAPPTA